MATEIPATNPVVVPAEGSVTYDKWYLTQLIAKVSPDAAPTIVTLRRSAVVNGQPVLMPNTSENATVSFTLDVWKELATTPQLAAALEAVLVAVTAYATKKKLL